MIEYNRKKILYIHQFFKTPYEPGGTRSYWFAKELASYGYSVTMITARSVQKNFIEKVNIDGIEVIYIRNAYYNTMSYGRRFLSFTLFMIVSTFLAFYQKKVDLVFATSTPLTVGFPALVLKWLKGINYIFEVRDLWPEAPIQLGSLKKPVLIKIALWFEKCIYSNAYHIIALSPGMKEGVLSIGIPDHKVTMIPNMSKIDEFFKREKNVEIAEKFNIDINKFNVVHFGTMTLINGLEYLIDTAEIFCQNNIDDVSFILMGNGSTKNKLVNLVNEKKLTNVIFIDKQPMKIVSEVVNLCDVSVVPVLNNPILSTSSPNRLFDSFSAGLPVVVNSAGWHKEIVEKYSCGAYVDPENPFVFFDLIMKWKSDPELVKSMGLSARYIAENIFDKSILCKSFISTIDNYFIMIA